MPKSQRHFSLLFVIVKSLLPKLPLFNNGRRLIVNVNNLIQIIPINILRTTSTKNRPKNHHHSAHYSTTIVNTTIMNSPHQINLTCTIWSSIPTFEGLDHNFEGTSKTVM
jgi:hypothetical protein